MCEILSLTALCRCCHADGNFKSLKMTYSVDNCDEVYSEMLENTLGIYVQSPSVEASYTICDNCIAQLRNATNFKKQVEECEKKFREYCKNELLQQMDIKLEKEVENDIVIKPEIVIKTEVEETFYTDDDNDSPQYESREPETIAIEFIPERVIETPKKEKPINKTVRREKTRGKLIRKKITNKPVRFTKIKTDSGFKFTCIKCRKCFNGYNRLRRHLNKEHTHEFTCKICKEKFTKYPQYCQHLKSHREKRYRCNYCDKSYRTSNDLQVHENGHTRERVFICDICKKQFLYKNSLKQHLLWHMGMNKKYMCDTCGHSFNDATNLRIHISTVHEKLKPYKCQLCPKSYAANKNLKLHMRRHTGENPYRCDMCSKAFICFSYLARHKTIHKSGDTVGNYVCKICHRAFHRPGVYRSHLKKHAREKQFQCDECDKQFVTRYTLNRHKEVHSGTAKRYKCDLCSATLSTNSLLKRHLLHLHDPSRECRVKVTCQICKMSVYNMEKHMKSHTDKRYKCCHCDKSYSEKKTMNTHIKVSHEGIKYPCEMCGKIYVQKGSLKRHMLKSHDIKLKKEVKYEIH